MSMSPRDEYRATLRALTDADLVRQCVLRIEAYRELPPDTVERTDAWQWSLLPWMECLRRGQSGLWDVAVRQVKATEAERRRVNGLPLRPWRGESA